MTESSFIRRRQVYIPVLATAVLLCAVLVMALTRTPAGATATSHNQHQAQEDADRQSHHGPFSPHTRRQVAFHDDMRKLWEDHITWTRLAIVTFAGGSAGFDTTAARLLENQVDIGDAFKPFYGEAAGDQLTALLHDHITIAVEILQAAKAGDTAAFEDANDRWYANGNDIADFWHSLNPRFWGQSEMREMMTAHLDQTLAEASHELGGDFEASIADYEEVHHHILMMSDELSSGIMRQFPHRFR